MLIECDLYNGKDWRIVELSDVDQSDERGYRICSQLYIGAANVDLITAKLNDDCSPIAMTYADVSVCRY